MNLPLHGAAAPDPAMPAHPPQPGEALQRQRAELLKRQVRYCWDRSPVYRALLESAGATPEDIRGFDDFARLRIAFRKADELASEERSLRERGDYLGAHLCADPLDVVGISATSGTTGRPTFTYLFTQSDLRLNALGWARALTWMGAQRGELVMNALGLSMWVVGAIAINALLQIGARPIPVGAEAGVPRILQMMSLLRPTTLLATPSMAQRLLEQAPEVLGCEIGTLGVRRILCCGEPGAGLPDVRRHLEQAYRARVYDAMLGAWGVAQLSCDSDSYHGLHQLTPDLVHSELVHPETLEPVAVDGKATGRLLVTSLRHEARPPFKFDAGDIVEVDDTPCPGCGQPHRRLRVLGRADDMLILRGVNLYPASVKNIVAEFIPEVTGEIRIVLDEPPPRVAPPLQLKVERGTGADPAGAAALKERIEARIFAILRVRAAVTVVEPMSLQRATVKSAVFEHRYRDS